MKLLRILLLALMFLPAVHAQIDLISPVNDIHTRANVTFDYYNGVENPISCTLSIPPQTLPDITVSKGMNAFIVQGIDAGQYNWSVSCENATETQTSETRTLTVDTTPPNVQIIQPNTIASELDVTVLVTDDASETLNCVLTSDQNFVDQVNITEGASTDFSYPAEQGNYTLEVACSDEAGNTGYAEKEYEIRIEDYLILETDTSEYGLGATIYLTIDAPADANLTVDICPNEVGFVECVSPLIVPGFPQTVQLPTNNKSGNFLVEGIMSTPRGTIINSTSYTVENTIGLTVKTESTPLLDESFTLRATVFGAIGAVTYAWDLHNGSTRETDQSTIIVKPKIPGTHTDTVTITDEAGNQKTNSVTYVVEESKIVSILVSNTTGKPVADVSIQVGDEVRTTGTDGKAQIRLAFGTEKIYVGKTGYTTIFRDVLINESTTQVAFTLTAEQTDASVVINEPVVDATYTKESNIALKFTTNGFVGGTCSLYMAPTSESFLEQKGTLEIESDGQTGFSLSDLDLGQHAYSVECALGNTLLSTQKRYFTITETQEAIPETIQSSQSTQTADPGTEKILFENALASLRSLPAKEQEFIGYLELEQEVRTAMKRAGQLSRDIFDIQYRTELSSEEKTREQERMQKELDQLMEETPINVELLDSRTVVDYISEEEIQEFITTSGITLPSTKILLEAQQRYTLKTKLYRAEVKYADGKTQKYSVVAKTFAYGAENLPNGAENEYLIEIIPKEIAESAQEITFVTEYTKILVDDPVISFPAGETIVYYVTEDVSLSKLEEARSLLVPEFTHSDNIITGYSIFGLAELEGVAGKLGISLSVLITILVFAYLTYYFGLIDRVKYLFYAGGPKTKLHYMRVLLNDVHDHIAANNYEKAILIYKEVKLTYEQLAIPEKNELFDEITLVCAELDKSYMKQLVVFMNDALKAENIEEALQYYAHIEATYERLPEEEQKQIYEMVTNIAKRLGVAA